MSNAGKIADAKTKLARGMYDGDPHRKATVEANIERWQAEDDAPVTAVAEEPKPPSTGPTPSRAAAKLLEERGFTVADMVASEVGTTGDKVTIDEVRVFLAAQDG